MNSFISTLSLFLLVLASGYFTFPINDGTIQNATISSSVVEGTSQSPFIPRALLINEATTQLSNIDVQETTDALMTTSADDLAENASRQSRVWNEMTTVESSSMLTTDETKSDKRGAMDWETTTMDLNDDETTDEVTTQPKSEKRGTMDLETTTIDLDDDVTTNEVTTQPKSEKRGTMEWETTTIDLDDDVTTDEVTTQPKSEKRDTMDVEFSTAVVEGDKSIFHVATEPKSDKREYTPEATTITLPLESPSSTVVSEFTTVEPTTGKYIGLLEDKKEQESELEKEREDKKPVKTTKIIIKDEESVNEDEDKKPIKPIKQDKDSKLDKNEKPWKSDKPIKKDEDSELDKNEKPWKSDKPMKKDEELVNDDEDKKPIKSDKKETEDLKNIPTAQLFDDGLKNVSNIPKEYMELDENTVLAVTQSESSDLFTTMENIKGKKPLNQGKESKPAKEKESDN